MSNRLIRLVPHRARLRADHDGSGPRGLRSSKWLTKPVLQNMYLVAFLVRAREEGLSFGLSEFRQLVLVKRNQHNSGTFLVSLRPGRHIIEDIPYRDEK
ncbi:hypothetical protein DY000_02032584 [Brassica cretica]|uniref:SH2 domain-containing protein n=1 Tax=Brassica cretica TaxID=69181 RepID=A0ABQ7DWB1_BRACR|nr:hypothetical protein DY000_02032584 [Brassica cretica]